MIKNFYSFPWIVKVLILLPAGVLGMFILLTAIELPFGYFLIFFTVPFINFSIIPLSRLLGMSTYLSPMVMTFGKDVNDYQLHNVMSFDYVVNFKWSDRGPKAQRMIIAFYFEALLHIIDKIETGELPRTVNVVGNSYFFNDRTAQKLGFTISKASLYRILNSIFGCVELIMLYSFSQGKWSIPTFWKVKKVSILGEQLLANKNTIKAYHLALKKRIQMSISS